VRPPQITHPRLHLRRRPTRARPRTRGTIRQARQPRLPTPGHPRVRRLARHTRLGRHLAHPSAIQHRHHRSIPLLDNRQRHQRQSRPPAPKRQSRSRPAASSRSCDSSVKGGGLKRPSSRGAVPSALPSRQRATDAYARRPACHRPRRRWCRGLRRLAGHSADDRAPRFSERAPDACRGASRASSDGTSVSRPWRPPLGTRPTRRYANRARTATRATNFAAVAPRPAPVKTIASRRALARSCRTRSLTATGQLRWWARLAGCAGSAGQARRAHTTRTRDRNGNDRAVADQAGSDRAERIDGDHRPAHKRRRCIAPRRWGVRIRRALSVRTPRLGGRGAASCAAGRARERARHRPDRQPATEHRQTGSEEQHLLAEEATKRQHLTARRRVYHCHVPHQAALPRTLPGAWPLRVPPRPRRDTSQRHRRSIRAVRRHASSVLGWRPQLRVARGPRGYVGQPSAPVDGASLTLRLPRPRAAPPRLRTKARRSPGPPRTDARQSSSASKASSTDTESCVQSPRSLAQPARMVVQRIATHSQIRSAAPDGRPPRRRS
jgi:hypothetical protein